MLSAPAIEINPDLAPLLRSFAQVLGRIAPTLPTTRSPQGAISRDPEVVEEAQQDPLNYHGRVLARTGAEMLRAGNDVQDRLDGLQTPFVVFHGTADQLANPEWSRRLYERAAATDKTFHLYDGLYHETFNEPERETVLSDLSSWLRTRIGEK
jgi:alpha-beta hydrolase superfamily lysophospholipase